MTLTDFLLARIAEDEAFGTHDRHLAKRWDAECEAKRQIVRHYGVINDWPLRYLALPYADHQDYRDEWKP